MAELRAHGWFCFKVHGNEFTMAGLPDIIVCAEGLFIGLETKMEKGKTSRRQDFVHQQIKAAGGIAEVAVTKEQAVWIVRQALVAAKS